MNKNNRRNQSTAALAALAIGLLFMQTEPSAQLSAGALPLVAPVEAMPSTLLSTVPAQFSGPRTFAAGSLIIPRDECYQFAGSKTQDGYCVNYTGSSVSDDGLVKSYGLQWFLLTNGIPIYSIINPDKLGSPDSDTDGLHDDTNCPTGDPDGTDGTLSGRDFCVSNPGGDAITQYDRTADTFGPVLSPSLSPFDNIAYRGSPIVIDAADAPAALNLILNGALPVPFGHNLIGTFDSVEIHKAEVGFTADVFNVINTAPTKIAINPGAGGVTANSHEIFISYLNRAGLNFDATGASTGKTITAPAGSNLAGGGLVYEVVTSAEIGAGNLATNGYRVVWFPHYGYSNGATDGNMLGEIADFVETAGNAAVASCAAVEGFETEAGNGNACALDANCTNHVGSTSGLQFAAGRYMTPSGLDTNQVKDWGDNNNEQITSSEVGHPFVQIGNANFASLGGSLQSFKPTGATNYLPGTKRLISTVDTSDGPGGPDDDVDIFVVRQKEDDPLKGIIAYFGGHDAQNSFPAEVGAARIYLNTMFNIEQVFTPVVNEVSRSQPILAEVNGVETQFQGTFEFTTDPATQYLGSASNNSFEFPAVKGHMRGWDLTDPGVIAALAAGPVAFDSVPRIFDAGLDDCPAGTNCIPRSQENACAGSDFSGQCRTVFTNTTTGLLPTIEIMRSGGGAPPPSATLALMLDNGLSLGSAEISFLLKRIVAGKKQGAAFEEQLGGLDRSSPAVVPTGFADSPSADRPEMIYVGGLDGMMHAFCAETKVCSSCAVANACDFPGRELWAYAPRTQIPFLRLNLGRIDGSAKVIDARGDFDGNGTQETRTVLVFQTGDGEPGVTALCDVLVPPLDPGGVSRCDPTLHAIDITDPTAPTLLWERALPGDGLNVAVAGEVLTGAGTKPMVFVQTNLPSAPNAACGGCSGNGFYVAGISLVDGNTAAGVMNPPEWEVVVPYAATRGGTLPPSTGVTAGVAVLDQVGLGQVDTVVVPSLYGEIYVFEAGTGLNIGNTNPADPWVRFTTDFHAVGASPTIFSDGSQFHVLVVTGGFVERTGTSWTQAGTTQFAVSYPLSGLPVGTPLTDVVGVGGAEFKIDFAGLGAGNANAFAQAVVAGDEVFIVLDSADVNDGSTYGTGGNTGYMIRGDLSNLAGGGSANAAFAIAGGASSLTASITGQTAYVGSGGGAQSIALPGFDANGTGVTGNVTRSLRRMWLRVQ